MWASASISISISLSLKAHKLPIKIIDREPSTLNKDREEKRIIKMNKPPDPPLLTLSYAHWIHSLGRATASELKAHPVAYLISGSAIFPLVWESRGTHFRSHGAGSTFRSKTRGNTKPRGQHKSPHRTVGFMSTWDMQSGDLLNIDITPGAS